MLKNYLNVTLRNIRKNRGYSFIIIFGLALSLSLSLLITQMIYNFTRFDRVHENKDRIFRLVTTRTGENRTEDFATAPFPMASALTDAVLLAWWFNGVLLSLYDEKVSLRAELFFLEPVS